MVRRIANRFKFYLESLILLGAQYQLLFIAVLIVLVSMTAGFLVYMMTSEFKWYGESAWWAFLRLSDPGYLGDDKGIALAFVSTIVTVLGYVLFMGALIAIMSQWLQGTMRKLESGLTPIVKNDHILILGWTNRTPTVVRELMLSEGRVKRFLRRIGARKLHIVILAEEVSAALAHELREQLGSRWNRKQITFRSGSSLSIDHLRRVDFAHASRIILPGADFASEGSEIIDTRIIKSLLSIYNHLHRQGNGNLPFVVTELIDARKIPIAKTAYRGDLAVIASDSVISRLIAQNVRHHGLSYIYSELLTHSEGNEIYIREFPQLDGKKFHHMRNAFVNAIPMGVLRPNRSTFAALLNPPEGFEMQRGDRMIILARSYNDTEPLERFESEPGARGAPIELTEEDRRRRVLILGWNHKIPALVREFESYENESFDIDLLSLVTVAEREELMSRYDLKQQNVKLRHHHADYTSPSDLNRIRPDDYDNIVFLGSDWLESNEEADARTILGYLLLREMLSEKSSRPEILMELMDPENEKLFQQRTGEVLISPLILSHILAHVALRRDLEVVFEELFTVGGAEVYFRSASAYKLKDGETSFQEIEKTVAQHGDIALGVRLGDLRNGRTGGITLNPSRDSAWKLKASDEILVLTTYV